MRVFIRQGYQVSSLVLPAKLAYSTFLIFVALGIWTSWELYAMRVAPDVEARYVNEPPPAADTDDGPDIALDDPEPAAPAEPIDTKRDFVLDVFHQHLFSVGVVFLILAHLFMLTPLAGPIKTGVIALAALASLAHVIAPVIIWKTGGSGWLMPVTGAGMGVTWSAMTVWTFGAMWFGGGSSTS